MQNNFILAYTNNRTFLHLILNANQVALNEIAIERADKLSMYYLI